MSSKPLFACVLCGEDFTRKSSGKRHRRFVHNSLIVRYNEYIAGRVAGIYPKPIAPARILRKSKFVKFQGEDILQHSPSFITADNSADEISCGNTDMNNNISGNNTIGTYNPESRSVHMKGKKVDVIDDAINDARRLVELKDLCAKLSSNSQPIQNGIPLQPNFNIFHSNIQPLTITNSRRTFGFRIYNCERCLESPIVPVFYPEVGQLTNQATHTCRPERLADIEGMHDKQKRVLPLRDYSIECLKKNILSAGSPANRYKYLVALPLSNPPEEFLRLPNSEKPDLPVVLCYSNETHVELDLDREDQGNNDIIANHWASRAITQGLTQLTDSEISQFLQLVGIATFAFFKVRRRGSSHYYFMILSNSYRK
jgi:hypothetical protein